MTEEEQKLFRLYGKLPTHKSVLLKTQKVRLYLTSWYLVYVDGPRRTGPEVF